MALCKPFLINCKTEYLHVYLVNYLHIKIHFTIIFSYPHPCSSVAHRNLKAVPHALPLIHANINNNLSPTPSRFVFLTDGRRYAEKSHIENNCQMKSLCSLFHSLLHPQSYFDRPPSANHHYLCITDGTTYPLPPRPISRIMCFHNCETDWGTTTNQARHGGWRKPTGKFKLQWEQRTSL